MAAVATGWRRVNLVFFGIVALVAASTGLPHLGDSRITEAAAASRLKMPAKKPAACKAAAAAAGANDARVDALGRLQAVNNDWWDGVEVTMPWAAVSDAHWGRSDTWVGMITDAVEQHDVLNSTFTVEDPEFEDEQVCISGAQLVFRCSAGFPPPV